MKSAWIGVQANVPVLITGSPGVGKTAAIGAFAEGINRHIEIKIASICDPTEFSGAQVVTNEGDLKFVPAPWAKRVIEYAHNGRSSIVFFDEITTAAPASQAALLRVINERWVGDKKLPDDCWIIAAANPVDEAANGYELSAPLANRFCHIKHAMSAEQWTEGMISGFPPERPSILPKEWEARIPHCRSIIASFIRTRPGLLLAVPKDESSAGGPWPSPRSWDMSARMMAAAESVGDEMASLELISGCVGEGAVREFFAWKKDLDLPDPYWILEDPQRMLSLKGKMDRGDRIYAVLSSVAAAAISKKDKDVWRSAWQAVAIAVEENIAGVDIGAIAAKALAKNRPQDAQAPIEAAVLTPFLLAAKEQRS